MIEKGPEQLTLLINFFHVLTDYLVPSYFLAANSPLVLEASLVLVVAIHIAVEDFFKLVPVLSHCWDIPPVVASAAYC